MAGEARDGFRRYLEESGVVDVLSTALAALYEEEERPKNPLEFLKSQLGAPTAEDFAKLESQKRYLEQQLLEMHQDSQALRHQLAPFQEEQESEAIEQVETTPSADTTA